MKLKLRVFLVAGCLLALTSCGIISSLPPFPAYAELRLGDNGKRQVLIEQDEWLGVYNTEGKHGLKHWTQAWFELQGDGPVYAINQDAGHGDTLVGTITVDQRRKCVTLDLKFVQGLGGKSQPHMYNGTYHLALITQDPFFSNDYRK